MRHRQMERQTANKDRDRVEDRQTEKTGEQRETGEVGR